jgi:protein translocase SecG subunit
MSLLESSWFLVSSLIIAIILLVDPKDSQTIGNSNALLGSFSSPSSAQQFIYNFSAILIISFFVLTTALSLNN